MSRKGDMNDIETAKENILPIRQGRRADFMCSVLSNRDEVAHHEMRSYFENELRSYTGDDPLKIWLEYISWIEQNCITGGKDYNVAELTKQCLFALKDKDVYKDDPRIFPIWLKFANSSSDPFEVFNYMATNGFCLKMSHFYVEWAWKLEAVGNLRAANAVLQDGINIGAKPLDALQHAIHQLDKRSVKIIQEMEPSEALPAEAEERCAFNKLKPQGKKHLAPIMRVGNYVQERGHFHSGIDTSQKQSKSSGPFKIYQGDSKDPRPAPPQNGAPSYIFNSSTNKENIRKPDKWTNAKPSKLTHPQRLVGTRDLGFAFHYDEDQEGESESKAVIPKNPITDEFAVLSVKKKSTCTPPVALFEETNPNSKPMYDKVKVYCGGTEFSFEEIRAAVWFCQHRDSEEWMNKVQKVTHKLKDNCKISRESDSTCLRRGDGERTAEVPDVENRPGSERSVERSHFHSSCEKVVVEATGGRRVRDGNLSPQRTPPSDGMTADIRGMMQSLSSGPNVNCHISNHAGTEHPERNDSVSSHDIESVPGDAHNLVQRKTNVDTQREEPFKIYYDIAKDLCAASFPLKTNGSTQNIPDREDHPVGNGIAHSKRDHSVSSLKIEPVPVDADEVAHQETYLGSPRAEPFKIYCDVTEDLRHAASFQPKTNIPVWKGHAQRIHDIENIPPSDYCKEDKVPNSDELLQPSSGSTVLVGNQPLSNASSPEKERVDCEAEEQGNYTIIPPPDTQHFMLHALVASTPHAKAQPSMSSKDASPLNLCSFGEDNALRIHQVSGGLSASSKAKAQGNEVTKEELLAPAVSPKPAGHPEVKQLRISEPVTIQAPGENQKVDCENDVLRDLEKSSSRPDPSKTFEVATLDPFDEDSHKICLKKISKPLEQWDNYFTSSRSLKTVEHGETISFGDENYIVMRYLGQGSFATVYQAELRPDFFPESSSHPRQKKRVALKVGLPGMEWEFYISSVLHSRHEASSGIDVRDSVMKAYKFLSLYDGRVIMTDLCEYGTLVDVVNSYRVLQEPVPEVLVMYLTFQLLCIISRVHECGILHGDLKPDNFLVAQVPSPEEAIACLWTKTHCVRLIDFGRGVDLTLFKPKTAFLTRTKVLGCDGNFQRTPFVYEADWCGLAGTIHALLFSQYMKLQRNEQGIIMPTQKFKRYWCTEELWEPLFQKLLNLTVDDGEPDVKPFLQFIASKLSAQDLRLPFLRLKQHVRR